MGDPCPEPLAGNLMMHPIAPFMFDPVYVTGLGEEFWPEGEDLEVFDDFEILAIPQSVGKRMYWEFQSCGEIVGMIDSMKSPQTHHFKTTCGRDVAVFLNRITLGTFGINVEHNIAEVQELKKDVLVFTDVIGNLYIWKEYCES